MKIKTSDLTGVALDWAVGKAGGWHKDYPYSTDWAFGGPIIEREKISTSYGDQTGVDLWNAEIWPDYSKPCTARANGPTPLVAAMRCFVASKLGDTVNVPEGLE